MSEYKDLLKSEKLNSRLKIHSLHRYYGKLIPAIPSSAIKYFSSKNDLVFDPFSGSGTSAVEALRNQRNFIGSEINPLSYEISLVKTENLDIRKLKSYLQTILNNTRDFEVSENEYPFVINIDHWFKDYVKKDLIKLEKSINFSIKEDLKYKRFFRILLSSIIKNVSNADERHVFPGVSKRVRELERESTRIIETISVFEKSAIKKINYFNEFKFSNSVKIFHGDSSIFCPEKYINKVDLIVTNPPYISSVRYVETLKLELYWMGYLSNQREYIDLSKSNIGTDHYLKHELVNLKQSKYEEINNLLNQMKDIDLKSAHILSDYFIKMEKVIRNGYKLLKKDKYWVTKIADSKIKKIQIKTGILLSVIAKSVGFEVIEIIEDKINPSSRSLTTARNFYSDIILFDQIIVWKKL